MSTVTFDKLAYSEALKAGGFSHEQATVQANALDAALGESVATKYDIELVRRDLKELEIKLSGQMREMEQRIVIRLGGMMIVAVGAVAALVKLL